LAFASPRTFGPARPCVWGSRPEDKGLTRRAHPGPPSCSSAAARPRRLSPPVLPTSRPAAAAAAAVATPRTGRPPHLSSGQWRSLFPPTPARRRPGRSAQAAGSG
ncbi:hypothetical protein EI555_014278, partial [Monodon monoceros]